MIFSSVNKTKFPFRLFVISFLFLAAICQNAGAQISFVKNERANPLQHFAVASSRISFPVFTDIDNDGDLDCFSGEFNYSNHGVVGSHITFYKNSGDAKHPLFIELKGSNNPLSQVSIAGSVLPVFADIDGDGDQDFFVASNGGTITFYKNTGTAATAVFTKQSAAFNPLSGVKLSGNEIGQFLLSDLDRDGDLDCIVTDNEGNETYLVNAGSATQPRFVTKDINDPFSVIRNKSVNTVSLYDWNKDGQPDLFAGNCLYQNNAGRFIRQSFSPVSTDENQTATSWVDLDADGTPELVSGTADGRFIYSTLPSAKTIAIASIRVAPNPSTKYFTISLPSSSEKRTLKLTTADGKMVLSQAITGSTFSFGESLGKGIYTVQIFSAGNIIAENKIVKM